MSFENKVVLITGAGSGMGEATAVLFAENGADVIIVDRNEETAKNTAEKCKKYGKKVLVIKADLTKDDEIKHAMEETIKVFRKLDVLVNNAGIVKLDNNILSGNIMESYDLVMNTNLRAVVVMTSLAAPYLIESKGCIVNTSSVVTRSISKGSRAPVYVISKAGVDTFTKLSALELAPSGVRVNAVSPGIVYTNIFTNSGIDENLDQFIEASALKKCSDPSEVADLILFLASDKAKSITGSIYALDNGMALV